MSAKYPPTLRNTQEPGAGRCGQLWFLGVSLSWRIFVGYRVDLCEQLDIWQTLVSLLVQYAVPHLTSRHTSIFSILPQETVRLTEVKIVVVEVFGVEVRCFDNFIHDTCEKLGHFLVVQVEVLKTLFVAYHPTTAI